MPSWDMIASFWTPLLQPITQYVLPAVIVLLAIWVAMRMGGKHKESEETRLLETVRQHEGHDLTEKVAMAEAECGVLREVIAVFSKELATPSPDLGGNQSDSDKARLEVWNEYDQTAVRLRDPLGPEVREIIEPLRNNWMLVPPSSRTTELRRVFYRLHEVLEREQAELKTLKNLRAAHESKTPQSS